jgi:hypothetical protein
MCGYSVYKLPTTALVRKADTIVRCVIKTLFAVIETSVLILCFKQSIRQRIALINESV